MKTHYAKYMRQVSYINNVRDETVHYLDSVVTRFRMWRKFLILRTGSSNVHIIHIHESRTRMTMNDGESTDESLLTDIANGNRHAFSTLVDRHAKRFFHVAYRVVHNAEDAEDIVQDGLIALWQNPAMWDSGKGAKFTTWFYRVITNRALNVKKAQRFVTGKDLPDIADEGLGADEQLIENRQIQWMETHIRQLPDKQQLALNLCFFEGLSNKEAATIMGMRLKALQSLLMRAKSTLRQKAEAVGHTEYRGINEQTVA